jgi:acetyl-CoA carboxylase biotin carboxyl carrier protein
VKIDIEQIKELIAIVAANEVAELTVEVGGEKVTIKKSTAPNQGMQSGSAHMSFEVPRAEHKESAPERKAEHKEGGAEAGESTNGLVPVTSPMVGTFYRSSSPNAAPFVDVGDRIAIGQTVCIIEAMKLMNDMPAEVSGRVVKICADNGSTVEYGQPLFLVDPSA